MGFTKHFLEDIIEKSCTCDGGISFDTEDHDKDCPAQKVILNIMNGKKP